MLKDGRFPDAIQLDDWDRPLAGGRRRARRGPRTRTARWPWSRSATTGAALRPRDVAWTRRTQRGRGAAAGRHRAVPRAVAQGGGRPQDAQVVQLEQEPKLEGALLAMDAAHGRRQGHGRRLRLRAQQVQPRHPGLAAGGLGLQADRLRGRHREGRLHARHDHASTRPISFPDNQGGVVAAQLRRHVLGADPAAPRDRAEPEHPRHQDAAGGRHQDRASSTRRSWASRASCRPTCRSRSGPARRRSWR